MLTVKVLIKSPHAKKYIEQIRKNLKRHNQKKPTSRNHITAINYKVKI